MRKMNEIEMQNTNGGWVGATYALIVGVVAAWYWSMKKLAGWAFGK